MAEQPVNSSVVRHSWSNPVFRTSAFAGPNIPTTPQLIDRWDMKREHRRTIVYEQPDSKLVDIVDVTFTKPIQKATTVATEPESSQIPFVVPLSIKIGDVTYESNIDVRHTVTEDVRQNYRRSLYQKVEILPPKLRTVGTQTIDCITFIVRTRNYWVPKMEKKGSHSPRVYQRKVWSRLLHQLSQYKT